MATDVEPTARTIEPEKPEQETENASQESAGILKTADQTTTATAAAASTSMSVRERRLRAIQAAGKPRHLAQQKDDHSSATATIDLSDKTADPLTEDDRWFASRLGNKKRAVKLLQIKQTSEVHVDSKRLSHGTHLTSPFALTAELERSLAKKRRADLERRRTQYLEDNGELIAREEDERKYAAEEEARRKRRADKDAVKRQKRERDDEGDGEGDVEDEDEDYAPDEEEGEGEEMEEEEDGEEEIERPAFIDDQAEENDDDDDGEEEDCSNDAPGLSVQSPERTPSANKESQIALSPAVAIPHLPSSLSQFLGGVSTTTLGIADINRSSTTSASTPSSTANSPRPVEAPVFPMFANTPSRAPAGLTQTRDELLELCSGGFGFASSASFPTDQNATAEEEPKKIAREMDEDEEQEVVVKKKRPVLDESNEKMDEEEKDDDMDANEGKKPRRVVLEEDEDEELEGNGDDEEEKEEEEEEEAEEDVEMEPEPGKEESEKNDEEFDSDDEMAVWKRQQMGAPLSKRNRYLEDEAELSGSDVGSGDEDEDDPDALDAYEPEAGDADELPDEEEIRENLHKQFLKQQQDEEDRRLLYLQEQLLPDGELTGATTDRSFRLKLREQDDENAVPDDADEKLNEELEAAEVAREAKLAEQLGRQWLMVPDSQLPEFWSFTSVAAESSLLRAAEDVVSTAKIHSIQAAAAATQQQEKKPKRAAHSLLNKSGTLLASVVKEAGSTGMKIDGGSTTAVRPEHKGLFRPEGSANERQKKDAPQNRQKKMVNSGKKKAGGKPLVDKLMRPNKGRDDDDEND